MKYFAMLNDTGFPTAFYCEEIHGENIPAGVIEITDDQWLEFVNNPGQRRWEDGKVVEYIPPPLPIEYLPLTPRQFRDGLLDAGIMPDEITAKINEIPFDIEREKALNAWNYASMFYRDDPYIDMIAAMFEMTPEQVDTLWLEAQKGDR